MEIDGHECHLGDDGTLDTVIEVDGKEYRFGDTSEYQDPHTGELELWGFCKLCEEIIEGMHDE